MTENANGLTLKILHGICVMKQYYWGLRTTSLFKLLTSGNIVAAQALTLLTAL